MITKTVDEIMFYNPCDTYPRERVQELCGENKALDGLQVSHLDIPTQDRIWALTICGFLPDADLRMVTAAAAESVLHLYNGPSDAPANAVRVSRLYAMGEATGGELDAARAAAEAAAGAAETAAKAAAGAAEAAAKAASRPAAWAAAGAAGAAAWAAEAAAKAAAGAAWDTAEAAAEAASRPAAWAAAGAAGAAAWAAAWAAQNEKTLEIFRLYLNNTQATD